MGVTSIQWTDRTWSPLRVRVRDDAAEIARAKGYTSLVQIAEKMAGHVGPHCEHVSDGCKLCYSGTTNRRCLPSNGTGLPFDRRSRDLVKSVVDDDILMQALSWKKPQRVFVENQSDLFGEWYDIDQIAFVFATMAEAQKQNFQILTKRPARMIEIVNAIQNRVAMAWEVFDGGRFTWPLPNVWLGISCEDQKTADERIPLLLQTPAALRFVSYEPALGPVDFAKWMRLRNFGDPPWKDGINWIIVGGESGPGARPFDIQWARNTIRQCKAAGVACFVKQLGAKPTYPPRPDCEPVEMMLFDRKGGDMAEWPADLRVREFPR